MSARVTLPHLAALLAALLAASDAAASPAAQAPAAPPTAPAKAPSPGPGAAARPAPPPTLRALRLDALDAALTERWGRLFAIAGLMLDREPLDGDAYRLAGDAALLGGRPGEARRLLEKAQLIAPLDGTARLLAALARPLGPPAPGEPPEPEPPLRALAWLDLGENRHLSVPRFTCFTAGRALAETPGEPRAVAVRKALKCPDEPPAR